MCLVRSEICMHGGASMKAPPKRKGNCHGARAALQLCAASIKAPPPKRKGNAGTDKRFSDDYEPQ